MTYSEAIKSGFRLVNSKWQLIAVQAVMMLFDCIGFFIIVGIPLGIVFVIFGLDLTGLAEMKDVMALVKNPAELLSKYFGLILLITACFFLYVIMVTTVGFYVFSGSVGVIGRSVTEPSLKFSTRGFFAEARRLFFPMMWYSLLVGLIFLVITFTLGLFGGGFAAIVSAAKGQDSTLALFLGIFFSLVLVLVGLSLILGTLAVTVFGIAVLFFKGEGSVKSFTTAFRFLQNHQQAFWLCVILMSGYIFLSFFVMLIVYPFYLIPIIGTILSFPFQIARSYLRLVILAVIINYYHEAELRQTVKEERPGEASDVTKDGGSTSPEDISLPEAEAPEPALPQKDENTQT